MKVLYFDYSACLIIALLIASSLLRGLTKGRRNRVYFELLIVSLLAVVSDIFAVRLDNLGEGHLVLKEITHMMYLWLHNTTTPMYMIYLMVLTDTDHKLRPLGKKVLFSWVYVLTIGLLFTNPIHHKMFYFDATDTYTRGPLFFILYISAAYYIIYGIFHMILYRKVYQREQYWALFLAYPEMIAAVSIQLFRKHLLLEMFAGAIGLLLISTIIQRPEEYLNTETGFGKRTAYIEFLNRALLNGKQLNIIMINITNFTILRDMFGYRGMNAFLHNIADELNRLNKHNSFGAEFYYLGMGKFRMVLDYRYQNHTEEAAKMVNSHMQKDMKFRDMDINMLAVVCVVEYPKDIEDVDLLMAFGDDLDIRKYNGQVLYARDIYKKERYLLVSNIDQIINHALINHKFEVFYQPIYSVEEQRFTSAEALLRLKDDVYGFIPPDVFIPAAEKSGAIHRIGSYVLEEVCKFIASEEFERLHIDYIEINLSVTQCMRSNLADEVIEIMKRYHVKPQQINLEITETAAAFAQNAMMDNINRLTHRGIGFSLDDYGTGYSNIKRVITLPLQIVKIDKSFIDVEHNPKMETVVANTIRMLKDMNMKIVVEGVETEQALRYFSGLHCEYIQGYYFSKPLPKQDFIRYILDNKGNGKALSR
ncbi:MAG: EAL domain-containing protein [Wujia sp.]